MTQSDIYRLLLTVLLFANRQLSSLNTASDSSQTRNCNNSTSSAAGSSQAASPSDEFSYTGINDLLLLVMFTSLFSPDGNTSGTTF